jgi:hypothetical protein
MTDIILTIRFGVDDSRKNKKFLSAFAKWLASNYNEHAQRFLQELLNTAQVPFDGEMTTRPSQSLANDMYEEFHHPKREKNGKWFVDGIQITNKLPIWIKLENQWLKGRIVIKGSSKNIVIEPENVIIPLTENLFLKW